MKSPGPYIRERIPALYFFLVSVVNDARKLFTPWSIYITDSLGGSFKEYMESNDMPIRLNELKKGLDETSLRTIDVLVERFKKYPDEKNKVKTSKKKPVHGGLLVVETRAEKKKISRELNVAREKFAFLGRNIEESVFYFNHGLTLLPGKIKNYLKGTDFVDAGAYIGDSAIALNEYSFKKIWSVEMSLKSMAKYRQNMKAAGIDESKYMLINAGLSDSDSDTPIKLADTGSAGFSLVRARGKYDVIEVQCRSFDSIAGEFGISPRFIKADIEGNGLAFVKGAKETLVKNRPVISIAVYHNPFEFFEVKPFLEDLLENYTFILRKLSSEVKNNACHSEVVLLGFPSEILRKEGNEGT